MIVQPIYLLYGAIFLAALMLVEGLYLLYVDAYGSHGAVNRRMSMLASGKDSRAVYEKLRRKPMRRAHQLGPLGGPVIWLDRMIAQSGLTVSTGRMLLFMAGISVVIFLLLLYLAATVAVAAALSTSVGGFVLSLAGGIGLPVLYMQSRKGRRLKAFSEQLPDALDIMVRSLQAGHPISAAMGLVTKEMTDPIGTEFGIAVDGMTYGLDMREALESIGRRVELQDFQYVIVTINIQNETGGNLAEVLHNLSTVIRARFRMFKKIRALSAEGRTSAIVLSVVPFLTGAAIFVTAPTFYLGVADDPLFWPLIAAALGLMLAGIYVMYRMVNFRV